MLSPKVWLKGLFRTLLVLLSTAMCAAGEGRLVLVMDDLGNQHRAGLDAIGQPWVSTVAIMPGRPFSAQLAEYAHTLGKEVIIHAPMANNIDFPLGPMGLTKEAGHDALVHTLREAIASVPFAVGLSNHMGSRLTQDPEAMGWVMRELRVQGLYFFDSRTIASTIAWSKAREELVPWSMRHFFLDHYRTPEFMQEQWQKIMRRVDAGRTVTVIAHPYPETLKFLASLPVDDKSMTSLVPLSKVVLYPMRYARRLQSTPEGV